MLERIHCLEVLALAETEGAGRYDYLVDTGCPLAHADGEMGELANVSRQRVILVTDESGLERHLTRLRCCEREPSERIGQVSVNRTYYKYVGTGERFASVSNNTRNGGLCSQIADCQQH